VIASIDDIRQRTWDFALTIVTVIVLAALGLQSFVGTGYVWWAERSIPGWEASAGYARYVALMDTIAAPLIVVLVVVMGLCVPKRLFARRLLIAVSAAMVALGLVTGVATRSFTTGLTLYLWLAALIQVAVVVMTIAGVRGPSYLTEGRLTKTGSGLLHLGFVLFGIVVVALQKSSWMLPVFSASALFAIAGTALSFYAYKIAWHRSRPVIEAPFDWEPGEVGEDSEAAATPRGSSA
jgi:hypothetical protein